VQIETRHIQQESVCQQDFSAERRALPFIDSDSAIELTDAELACVYGGQALASGPTPIPRPTSGSNDRPWWWWW
jgi:hypothetical protein